MKRFASLAVAVLSVTLLSPMAAHAQAAAVAKTTVDAVAAAGVINNVVVPGGGGASSSSSASSALGTLANPQWIMGQSTVGPSVTSYDACTRTRSGSILGVGAGWSQSDDDCVRQRQAAFAVQFAPALGYEHMCKIAEFADSDAKTLRKCYATVMYDQKNAAAAKPVAVVQPVAAPPQRATRLVCLDMSGREVRQGTPGSSCGEV